MYKVGGAFEFTEVLFVPSLGKNLFSVLRACDRGAQCIFLEDNTSADVERLGQVMCTDAFVSNLYWIKEIAAPESCAEVRVETSAVPIANTRSVEAMMWHQRFAHLGFETLARMASLNFIACCSLRPVNFWQAWRDIGCEACIETKQMGKPHTKPSTRVSMVPLGRLFPDVTGNASDGYYVTLLLEATTWAATRALVHESAGVCIRF